MAKKQRPTVRDQFLINMDMLIVLSEKPSSISEIGSKSNLSWSETKNKVESLMDFGLIERFAEESFKNSRLVDKFRNTKKGEDLLDLVKLVHKSAPVEVQTLISKRS